MLQQGGAGLLQRIEDALGIEPGNLLDQGLRAVVILLLAWAGFRVLKALTARVERVMADGESPGLTEREQRARTLTQLLNSIGAVVIAVGAGLMILNLFINIGPLLAGVGVAGLAISFGAQSLVKDVISGFFILLENQFGVGDNVEINGVKGVVEKMSMRVVALRDFEGVLHIIPSGSISMVSNRTRGYSRTVLDIGVAYKESVDRVIDVMADIGKQLWEDREWRSKLTEQPRVWGVQALADSSVNIRIVANTQPGSQFDVGRELRRRIKNRFDAEGIEIPFPQRTLHFGQPELIEGLLRRDRS